MWGGAGPIRIREPFELAEELRSRCRGSGGVERRQLLDSFYQATGYGRKYPIKVLKGRRRRSVCKRIPRDQPVWTGVPVCAEGLLGRLRLALLRRLQPFLPDPAPILVRHDQLTCSAETIELLASVSAATMERKLGELSLVLVGWRMSQTKPGLGRLLRVTNGGLPRMDRAAVATETHLDGKYLVRSSDPEMTADEIAVGYKQLLQVERGWRDMKTTLDLRPVYHRKEERIRAHIVLCWLALLLIRVAENQTGQTWRNLRHELQRLHVGTFWGWAGRCLQRTELTPRQAELMKALKVTEPPLFLALESTPRTAA